MANDKIKIGDYQVLADEIIGHEDISEIGGGTVRGAIAEIGKKAIKVVNTKEDFDGLEDKSGTIIVKNEDYVLSANEISYGDGSVKNAIDSVKQSIPTVPTVDATLNKNSTNPISNKVVAEKFGGIETEISTVKEHLTTNLLKPTLTSGVFSEGSGSVTVKDNGNGTYSLTTSGTISANIYIPINSTPLDIDLSKQIKILGCPQQASDRYCIYDSVNGLDATVDYGNGKVYKPTQKPKYYILVRTNAVLNNVVFKPMVTTNLSAQYSDFVAYTGITGKLNSDVAEFRNSINIKQFDFNIGSSTQESATVGGYRNVATFSNISNELTGKTVIPVIITTKDATSRPFPAYCTKTSLVIMSTSSLASTAMTGTFLILG